MCCSVVCARIITLTILMNISGDSMRPAYLANVCVSDMVKRCGVGESLVQSAREFARSLGM